MVIATLLSKLGTCMHKDCRNAYAQRGLCLQPRAAQSIHNAENMTAVQLKLCVCARV